MISTSPQVRVIRHTSPLNGQAKYKAAQEQSISIRIAKSLNHLAEKLHSIQGIDETASAFSMSLKGAPQALEESLPIITASATSVEEGIATSHLLSQSTSALAGPAISLTSCMLATPIVGLGAYGATKECLTFWKKTYPTALYQVIDHQHTLIKLFEKQNQHPAVLNELKTCHHLMKQFGSTPFTTFIQVKKYGQRFLELALILAKESNTTAPESGYAIAQYQRAEAQRHIHRIERDIIGPTNTMAMTGMASGLPAAGAGAIATMIGKTAIAHTAETIAASIFMPAQAAMIIAGTAKASTGILTHQALKADKQALTYLETLNTQDNLQHYPGLTESLEQIVDQEIAINKRKIAAGALTAGGQSMMMAGTITSLTPAAVASPALFAVGAASTVSASAIEMLADHKRNKFKGANHSNAATEQAQINHQTIAATIKNTGLNDALKAAAQQNTHYQSTLRKLKFYSLLMKVLSDEEKKSENISSTAQQQKRLQKLDKMLCHGHKSFFSRTSLLKIDIELMQQGYRSGQYLEGLHNLQGSASALKSQVLALLNQEQETQQNQLIQQLGLKNEVGKKVLHATIKKLNKHAIEDVSIHTFLKPYAEKKEHVITLDSLDSFSKSNKIALNIYEQELAKHLINQGKEDAKFLRHEVAQQILLLVHTAKFIADNQPRTTHRQLVTNKIMPVIQHPQTTKHMPLIMDAYTFRDYQRQQRAYLLKSPLIMDARTFQQKMLSEKTVFQA